MSKKNIWIINHYATNMFYNKAGRHYWFAKYLKSEGYNPVIFSCNVKHGVLERYIDTKDLWVEQEAEEIQVPFIFVKSNLYENSGIKRILNMLGFYKNVKISAEEYAKKRGNPDVIYASSVHPLTLVAGIQLAKHFGIKCICEVRDLWPESIVAYSKKLTKSNVMIKLLYKGEKWIYSKADKLIFTMEGGSDYIKDKGWNNKKKRSIDISKIYHINNGVDLKSFYKNKSLHITNDNDLIDDKTFKVIYTGSIRPANNVKKIVEAAKDIQERGFNKIKFMIYGEGSDRIPLMNYCMENNINNVFFKGHVDKCQVPYILNQSDLNILHFEQNSLNQYGSSLNKMFEYFASGKPTLSDCEFGYDLINRYKAGVSKDITNSEEFAGEILKFYQMDKQKYEEYSSNALKAAKDYDFKLLTQRLIDIIERV